MDLPLLCILTSIPGAGEIDFQHCYDRGEAGKADAAQTPYRLRRSTEPRIRQTSDSVLVTTKYFWIYNSDTSGQRRPGLARANPARIFII